MFDYSLAHWLTFLGAAFVLEITPGPSMLYILAQTARRGRGHGLVGVLGLWTGSLIHILAAILGLAAILAQSAMAFTIVKWIGGAYLVWLGIKSLRSAQHKSQKAAGTAPPAQPAPNYWGAYWQGILVDALNPKAALFYLAFIPQFVVPGAGSVAAQFAFHCFLLFMIAVVVEPAVVFAGDRMVALFKGKRRLAVWAECGVGAVFIGLGARLAVLH